MFILKLLFNENAQREIAINFKNFIYITCLEILQFKKLFVK